MMTLIKDTIYHCNTKELIKQFLEQAKENSITWFNSRKIDINNDINQTYNRYGSDTCFRIHNNSTLTFADKPYFEGPKFNHNCNLCILEYKAYQIEPNKVYYCANKKDFEYFIYELQNNSYLTPFIKNWDTHFFNFLTGIKDPSHSCNFITTNNNIYVSTDSTLWDEITTYSPSTYSINSLKNSLKNVELKIFDSVEINSTALSYFCNREALDTFFEDNPQLNENLKKLFVQNSWPNFGDRGLIIYKSGPTRLISDSGVYAILINNKLFICSNKVLKKIG